MPPQMKGVDNPLAQFILPVLGRGLVSVNTQTILQLAPDGLGLHNIEDRWAAYNVGELLGLPGLWSVAPILVLWGVRGGVRGGALRPDTHETPGSQRATSRCRSG